jgi:Domain of unknown function (DUF4190)
MSYPPDRPEDSPSQEPYQPQTPYQQPQFQPQPRYQYPQPVVAGRTNTMAILALVFAFVFWPLGIVFGHMARRQIRQTGEGGAGLATAGLVLSYLFGVLTLLGCVAWIALVVYAAGHPGVLPTPTY